MNESMNRRKGIVFYCAVQTSLVNNRETNRSHKVFY